MARQVRWGLAQHYRGVVLLGSDCLGLETGDLRQALQLLGSGEKPLVLGPAQDGGYWLMGQRCFDACLFSGLPWGSHRVGVLTKTRACASGFQVHTYVLAPMWTACRTYSPGWPPQCKRRRRKMYICKGPRLVMLVSIQPLLPILLRKRPVVPLDEERACAYIGRETAPQ